MLSFFKTIGNNLKHRQDKILYVHSWWFLYLYLPFAIIATSLEDCRQLPCIHNIRFESLWSYIGQVAVFHRKMGHASNPCNQYSQGPKILETNKE